MLQAITKAILATVIFAVAPISPDPWLMFGGGLVILAMVPLHIWMES